jgi:branched-chain amino acid transport system substrate-binding protein
VLALATLVSLPVLLLSATATAASTPRSPLTVALVLSETGQAATQDVGAVQGFEARLRLANSAGGVNGHKLVPLILDDQTNPTTLATAVQEAISKGAIGIVSDSALFFLADKYPQQAGVPVTGTNTDGPEWGKQPFTNMFSSDFGSVDPKYPASTLQGQVVKLLGGTVAATYGYGISPNSTQAVQFDTISMKKYGITVPVQDASVPLGSVDFTSAALIAKQHHVNALFPNLEASSDYALATAYRQAGIKLKAAVFPVGLQQSLIGSPAWQQVQGDYFMSLFHPFTIPDAGTEQMRAALEKYTGYSKNNLFPAFGDYEGWLGADLMVKGIAASGSNPTRAGVIRALRGVKAYNGNGILPITINYSTVFGHLSPQCVWIFKAEQPAFTLVQKNPICGQEIPGTDTSS